MNQSPETISASLSTIETLFELIRRNLSQIIEVKLSEKDFLKEFFHIEPVGEGYELSILQPQDNSHFASHFPGKPIVPGVAISSLVQDIMRWISFDTITREFIAPLIPGMKIEITGTPEQEVLIVEALNKKVLARFTMRKNVILHGVNRLTYTPPTINQAKEGKYLVPHGDRFRFVDQTWIVPGDTPDDTELSSKTLHGIYTLKEGDLRKNTVPWWLLEESAAQMMLGGYRAHNGPESEIMTYGKAETQVYDSTTISLLEPGDTIFLVGHFIERQKRQATGEYSMYALFQGSPEAELLFSGRITGNLIPLKVWNR